MQSDKAATNVTINPLFTDHMVIQRQMPVPVWGTAQPNGRVSVEMNNQLLKTVSDKNGNWKVILEPMEAGGPHEVKISGVDTILIKDVLIGEVWLGSGQSNMEMPLAGWGKILNYKQEIENANYPQIRLFQAERTMSLEPEKTISSEGWRVCSPNSIPEFSATAYFFGRYLHKNLQVPVGIIHSSWGGTIIEAWTSAAALKTIDDIKPQVEKIEQAVKAGDSIQKMQLAYEDKLQEWVAVANTKDHGKLNQWQNDLTESGKWKTMKLPNAWEKAGLPGFDGVVWFRKTINLDQK